MAGMSGTVGDGYTLTAYQADGVTPITLTNLSSAVVAIRNQLGVVLNATPSNIANAFTFLTAANTFPVGGQYYLQLILTFNTGVISKSQIVPITINQSNE